MLIRRKTKQPNNQLQQLCSVCLVHITRMVCEMEGKWPFSYCFVECCFQECGVKNKESEKNHDGELKNKKVRVIPIVLDVLETVPKGLKKILVKLVIRGRNETIQTTVLLRSARIFRSVQRTRGDLR